MSINHQKTISKVCRTPMVLAEAGIKTTKHPYVVFPEMSDIHVSVGPGGIHSQVPRELAGVIAKQLSMTFERS